jgi:rod shape-determining protein MreC
LGASFIFMMLDYHYRAFNPLRSSIAVVIQPLHYIVDSPFRWIAGFKTTWQDFLRFLADDQQLKSMQSIDAVRLQRLSALELENAQLRSLLKASAALPSSFMMAEIMQVHNDSLNQRILLNRGAAEGVVLGQVVLDSKGVLGEIIEVYSHSSRAILLSDVGYGISVENTRSGLIGIVAGNGLDQPLVLQHVPNTIDIEVGDQLVTSGLEGRYPPGYAVGTITAVRQDPGEPFATVQVKAHANHRLIRHVLLIQKSLRHE